MNSLILAIPNDQGIDSVSLTIALLIIIAFFVGWAINHITILRIRKHSEQVKELLGHHAAHP